MQNKTLNTIFISASVLLLSSNLAIGIKLPNCGGDICNTLETIKEKVKKEISNSVPDCGGDICNTLETIKEKGKKEIKNALSDAEALIKTGKCGGDVCDFYAKAVFDIIAESERTGKNVEEAGQAIGKFVEHRAQGVGETLSDAERRLREGKVVDALWHLATDSVKHTENAAAQAARESDIVRAVGQIAAGAYGGPGGTAAYAAWLTYKATGDFELALKVGAITGATSYANVKIAEIGGVEITDTVKRAILSGAIGGAAVAASGGDNKAVLDGFMLSAGMVIVQDGYKKVTGHKLDKDALKHSEGEANCLSISAKALAKHPNASCLPSEDIFVRDENNQILYEDAEKTVPKFKDKTKIMAELDNRQPRAGKWSSPGDSSIMNEIFGETGRVMTGVSRVSGVNAMAVFHDQWVINWEMDPVSSVATIPPAAVITYMGTGGPNYDLIRESAMTNDQRSSIDSIDYHSSVSSSANDDDDGAPSESYIAHSFICTMANLVRQIAVEYPGPSSRHACRVLYKTEKGFFAPWSAENDRNYCKPRAIGLVTKQIANGWQCSGR